jgi:hypothetical protein
MKIKFKDLPNSVKGAVIAVWITICVNVIELLIFEFKLMLYWANLGGFGLEGLIAIIITFICVCLACWVIWNMFRRKK